MSAPVAVDVLAHLAGMALHYGEKWQAAHDAVAELIEAAKEKQRVTGGGAVCTVAESNAVYRRMEAALARVGGAV